MKYLVIIAFLGLIGFLALTSCNEETETDPCNVDWLAETSDEASAIAFAHQQYTSDSSETNCTSLQNAYQNYIDAIRPIGDCSILSEGLMDIWRRALEQAEEALAEAC